VAERAQAMEFIFKDEAFKFETLRAAGFAGDAGADIGEVIATTSRISEGDEEGWTNEWRATAERTAERGETSLSVGDTVSAREAFLRAARTESPHGSWPESNLSTTSPGSRRSSCAPQPITSTGTATKTPNG
jgi:hypothetical protein